MRRIAAVLILGTLITTAVGAHALAGLPATTPIPPKDWSGTIQAAIAVPLGTAYFEQNGCTWGGNDQLNGSDGLVWDVQGYGGLPGTMTWTTSSAATPDSVSMYFLDETCNRIAGVLWTSARGDMGKPLPIVIPGAARYAAVTSNGLASQNVQVTLHSDGYTPPKKKKHKK